MSAFQRKAARWFEAVRAADDYTRELETPFPSVLGSPFLIYRGRDGSHVTRGMYVQEEAREISVLLTAEANPNPCTPAVLP